MYNEYMNIHSYNVNEFIYFFILYMNKRTVMRG